ncbi:hypothetical protein AB0F95_04760 [Micromonospora tulbaghiae]|uniref:hypothetical protein n=1 Tax=Micromonospora tulbaghiae TaxID=479978 RepID=UPI0033E4DE93
MAELFRGQDVFDILELTRQHEVPVTLSGFKESQADGMASIVDIVALVALGIGTRHVPDARGGAPTRPANSVIEEICSHARQLSKLASMLSFADGAGTTNPLAELAGQLRATELMIRAKHYESIGQTLNAGVFNAPQVKAALENSIGFHFQDILSVASAIKEHYSESKAGDLDVVARAAQRSKQGHGLDREELQAATDAATRIFVSPGSSSSFTADMIAQKCGLPADRVKAVLEAFSVQMPLETPEALVQAFTEGRNALAGVDLINDGHGNYLLLQSGIPVDLIRRRVETRLKSSGKTKAWDQYGRHRDKFAESFAARCIGKILGDLAPQHLGLKYLAPPKDNPHYDLSQSAQNPKSQARVVESDALFLLDDVAICLEVKAGSVTDKARSGNVQRMAEDLKKTIGEATSQAQRLKTLIIENRGLWRDNGKWLDLSEVREVHTVVACLDDFGPLAIAADALVRANLLTGTTLPWIVSLHDLAVAERIIDCPATFLLYLRRRTEPNSSKLIVAVDELDVLMWFMKGYMYFEADPDELHRRYPTSKPPTGHERANFRQQSITRVGTFTDDLDAWIYYEEGLSDIPAPKPSRHENDRVRKLIDFLANEKRPGWLRLGADLFNLSPETQLQLADNISRIVDQTRRDKAFHTLVEGFATPWGYPLFFVGTQPLGYRGAYERLRKYMLAKKYQLRAESAFGVLVDESGAVVASEYLNLPFTEDPALEALIEEMKLVPIENMYDSRPPSARRKTKRLKPGKKKGR